MTYADAVGTTAVVVLVAISVVYAWRIRQRQLQFQNQVRIRPPPDRDWRVEVATPTLRSRLIGALQGIDDPPPRTDDLWVMGNVGLKQRARLQALEKAWEDTQRDFFDRLDMVDDFDALALSEEISWLGAKPRTSEEYEKRMGPLRVRIERALRHFERD